MTNDDNYGPWIEHDGGPCPILDFDDWNVEVKFRNGKILPCKAEGVWENFEGHPYADIIAYRVRLPADDLLRQAVDALREYMTSVDLMNAAMRDGLNVHGALSQFTAAEDQARAVLAAAAERGL